MTKYIVFKMYDLLPFLAIATLTKEGYWQLKNHGNTCNRAYGIAIKTSLLG
jgi:hypothetical protein